MIDPTSHPESTSPAHPSGAAAPTSPAIPTHPSIATVLAWGLLASVAAKLAPEALGHGLACVLGGGEWRGFSSSWSVCETSAMAAPAQAWMHVSGTVVGLVSGALVLVGLRVRPPRRGNPAYALWLFAVLGLFAAAFELMSLPFFRAGDWEEVLVGRLAGRGGRFGLAMLGAGAAGWAFTAARERLDALLLPGGDATPRVVLSRWLCWLPFLALGCGLMPLAAFLNVLGLHYAVPAALSSVGSSSLLFLLPFTLERRDDAAQARTALEARRWHWGLLVALVLVVLLALGPGVPLMQPGR